MISQHDLSVRYLVRLYGYLTPVLTLVPVGVSFGAPHLLAPFAALLILAGLLFIVHNGAAILILLNLAIVFAIAMVSVFSEGNFERLFAAGSLVVVIAPSLLPFTVSRPFRGELFAASVDSYRSGLGISCCVGIGLAVGQIRIRENQQSLFVGDGDGLVLRAGGLVGNSGGFGATCALLVLLAVFVPVARDERLRLRDTLLAVAGLVGLGLSGNRAALVAVAVGVCIALLLRPDIPAKLGVGKLVAVAGAALVALAVGASSRFLSVLRARFDFLNVTGDSTFFASARRRTWPEIARGLADSPLIGQGPQRAFGEPPVDNTLLSWSVEWGPFAGLFCSVLLLSAGWQFFRWRGSGAAFLGMVVLGCLLTLSAFIDLQRSWFVLPPLLILLTSALSAGSWQANFRTLPSARLQKQS